MSDIICEDIFTRAKQKYESELIKYWPQSSNKTDASIINDDEIIEKIKEKLIQEDAILIAHYYVDAKIQKLAEQTGGIVADSLEMAKFGAKVPQKTLIVCGVNFMGQTAKILSPNKKVIMPNLKATCSLDLNCPIDEFNEFCDLYPDREVIVYANSSVEVKARADWVVTSSIALDVVSHLSSLGKKMIWAPDKYLGQYIKDQTKADILLWQGSCIVHEEFKDNAIKDLLEKYPDASLLVHPESPKSVVKIAQNLGKSGCVGSTSQLLKASINFDNKVFIIATDAGILYQMQKASPDKIFIEAPTGGTGATCKSCARCPWMGMNDLEGILSCFGKADCEVESFSDELMFKAKVSLGKMVDFYSK
jgi:quinolinate synthase